MIVEDVLNMKLIHDDFISHELIFMKNNRLVSKEFAVNNKNANCTFEEFKYYDSYEDKFVILCIINLKN